MKNTFFKISLSAIMLYVIASVSSCKVSKGNASSEELMSDLVCGMKVSKSEAYIWEYEGKKYYFDSYNCKETFIMNPKKYIENKCSDTK